MVPTFWEVRRMSPNRVPLGLRVGEVVDPSCGASVWILLSLSSLPGLELRRLGLLLLLDDGEDNVVIAEGLLYLSVDVTLEAEAEAEKVVGGDGLESLKIWTVSVAEETQRREDEVLKDML